MVIVALTHSCALLWCEKSNAGYKIPFVDRSSKRVNSRVRSKIETRLGVATFLDREGNTVSARGDQR